MGIRSTLAPLSGIAKTLPLQAKKVLLHRRATCHSSQKAGIQKIDLLSIWMPDQVRHDKTVDINQPDLRPFVL